MTKENLEMRIERLVSTINGTWEECKETDTQFRLEENEKGIFLSFPGSISTLDWLQNFDFFKIPYKEQSTIFFTHKGFTLKYKSVRDMIHTKIKTLSSGKPLYIQGYSQGGALAQLAHEDMVFNFSTKFSKIDTIVFGSPRVFSFIRGNKVLKERLKGLVRIINANDIVPHIPPILCLFGDYGEALRIGKSRKFWKLSVKDHLPQQYETGLT